MDKTGKIVDNLCVNVDKPGRFSGVLSPRRAFRVSLFKVFSRIENRNVRVFIKRKAFGRKKAKSVEGKGAWEAEKGGYV